MAEVVDPQRLSDPGITIPGLKPPVRDFTPVDDGDPSEVDGFNRMIRELRDQNPAALRIEPPRRVSRSAL